MHPFPHSLITPDLIDRRTVVKGVTLGAGAVILQPFLDSLAAQAAGQAAPAATAGISAAFAATIETAANSPP